MVKSRVIWAVLLTALSNNCMNQQNQPPVASSKPAEKNSSIPKPVNFEQYRDKEGDDWVEGDEKTDSLSLQNRSISTQAPHAHHADRMNNFIEGLKQRPDASAYDSDEIEEILQKFETPRQPKK